MYKEGISVIICCYNSEWIIRRCLDALSRQQFEKPIDWEVVVVDNCCTDCTHELVQQYSNNSQMAIFLVDENNPGLLNARRKGIDTAQYKYAIFCDDDNILSENYVYEMYRLMAEHQQLGCAGGRGIADFQAEPDPIILQCLDYYATGSQKNLEYLYGAGICVRTDVVSRIYHSQHFYLSGRCEGKLLSGDDTELVISILLCGYQQTCRDDLTFHHVLPARRLTFNYLKSMVTGFGVSSPMLSIKGHAEKGRPFAFIYLTYIKCMLNCLRFFAGRPVSQRYQLLSCYYWSMLKSFHFWHFKALRSAYNDCMQLRGKGDSRT